MTRRQRDFYAEIMNTLREEIGDRCSTYLSPGESEWSINDPGTIFDLPAGEGKPKCDPVARCGMCTASGLYAR